MTKEMGARARAGQRIVRDDNGFGNRDAQLSPDDAPAMPTVDGHIRMAAFTVPSSAASVATATEPQPGGPDLPRENALSDGVIDSVGDLAIIGVSTEDTFALDSLTFILLDGIASGTQIFFTDRAWNGTVFAAAGGGDGTFTYTAGSNLPAGTVVTISQAQLTAAGMALADTGETIYAYLGAINAPTRFLHAVDIGDQTSGFDGTELTNTGLVNNVSAVSFGTGTNLLDIDNAEFGGRTHNIQIADLFARINTPSAWAQNNNTPQDGTAPGSPAFIAPDAQLIIGGSGGGEAIITVNLDGTYSAGTLGYQIVQASRTTPVCFTRATSRSIPCGGSISSSIRTRAGTTGSSRATSASCSAAPVPRARLPFSTPTPTAARTA